MRLFWTPGARESLRDATGYIRQYSPSAARQLRRRVLYRVDQLKRNPELGRMVPEYEVRSIRELIEGDYRIWYRLRDDQVEILAVLHGARQILP